MLDQQEITEEEGLAFYQRLLTKSDEELEAGGLPREEVQEVLGRTARKANKPRLEKHEKVRCTS
ncbi:DUF6483 family protein [Paenibacillus sp. JTLBN-2024]